MVAQPSIKQLIEKHTPQDITVSIYMPTIASANPRNLTENQTRYKNQLSEAKEMIDKFQAHDQSKKNLWKQLSELDNDAELWSNSNHGLAIFATPGTAILYRLPLELDAFVHVGTEFFLLPLLVEQNLAEPFYVLNLNLSEPKLLQVNSDTVTEVTDINLPGEIKQALRIDDVEQEQQFHSLGKSGGNQAVFHGHGGEKDQTNSEINQYFHLIDEAICNHNFAGTDGLEKPEIILAGTIENIALYRSISKYPELSTDQFNGSYENDLQSLRKEYAQLQAERISRSSREFREEYEGTPAHLKSSPTITSRILGKLSNEGRIKTLAVSLLENTRDSVRGGLERIYKLKLNAEHSDLLKLNEAAMDVWKKSGSIVALTNSQSSSTQTYALLRY